MLHQPRPPETSNKPNCYRSIINIPGLTPTISNDHNTEQLYKSSKDPIPHLQKSNVIYKIDCLDCQQCYIGMTTNQLKTRMYGHQTLLNTLQKCIENGHQHTDPQIQQLREKTALMDHCITLQHTFDVNKPVIIDSSFKAQSLPVLEMCHIKTTPHTVNRRTDTIGLSAAYSHLLETVCRPKTKTQNRQQDRENPYTHTTQEQNVQHTNIQTAPQW